MVLNDQDEADNRTAPMPVRRTARAKAAPRRHIEMPLEAHSIMTAPMVIRQIQPDEGVALRRIRLRAICDTPDAFAVSLADTLAETEAGWTTWATQSATGNANIMYVAEDRGTGTWIGIAGGMRDTSRPQEAAHLISVWVDPAYRGRGLGRQLVEHVVRWAHDRGVRRLELWVAAHNTTAIALYTCCGFILPGESQPLPSNPTLMELRMTRDL